MAMEVHATSWAPLDHGSMTTTSGDSGATESRNDQRRCSHISNPGEQDWAAVVSSVLVQENDPASSNNMGLGLFDIDNMDAQFGAIDFPDQDPVSTTTTSSSLSSSVADPNGAPHPFQPWHQSFAHAPPPLISYEQHTPFQSAQWMPEEQHYEHQLNFGMHIQREGLGVGMPPTSNPIDIPTNVHYNRFMEHESPMMSHDEYRHDMIHGWERPEHNVPPQDELFGEDEERDGADPADPCYAQLLYQCLREAPNHTLSLRELYEWVSQHSQKAKDPKNRGWQNSVRHNLSMNAAFARVPHHANGGPKKGSLWRLTDEALRDGVISTTRYRKDPKRKPDRRAGTAPALNRQASGAKGGRATRDATRYRQQQQQQRGLSTVPPRFRHHPRAQYSPYSIRSVETSPQPGFAPLPTPATSPYFIDDHSAPHTPPPYASTPPSQFQFNNYKQQQPHLPQEPKPFGTSTGFEFLPLDHQYGGLFGNHDSEIHPGTPTPSLMTEASFMTDENLPPSAAMLACESGEQQLAYH